MKPLAFAALLLSGAAFGQASASIETTPIPSGPTSAVDTAIWVHPTDVTRSLVFGTDQISGGLYSWRLDGGQHQVVTLGPTRAVDVRHRVPLGGGFTDVVLAVAIGGEFRLFAPDSNGLLVPLDRAPTVTGLTANAAALHLDAAGQLSVFISNLAGTLEQWRISDDGSGHLVSTRARSLVLGAPVDGLAVDDRAGRVFLSLQNRGIYRLESALDAGFTPLELDSVDAGRLAGPKGLAIYFTPSGGYLIASSSQTNTFAVYSLVPSFPFITSFSLTADAGSERVRGSVGIEVAPLSLGAPFDQGLFVAHDALNLTGPNYKLVKWDAIASSTSPRLIADTRFDPRQPFPIGDGGACPPSDGGDGGCPAGPGADGGLTASPPPQASFPYSPSKTGCGCGETLMLSPLAALVWLKRLHRRRRVSRE